MEAQQQIKSIADKLQQVLQRHQALQKENEQLVGNMRVLKERGSAQQQKIDELELKLAALKIATGQLNDTEKKDVDKRLNQYIREIDRCIAMLSD